MNKFLVISSLFFFYLSLPVVTAQDVSRVNSIRFEGLKKYKEDFLRHRIGLTEMDTIYNGTIQKEVQNLRNLYGVLHANARIENGDVTFQIEEKNTLLPVVNFGGIKDNIWFQLGGTDVNWLGRGHQFLAYYQYNDNRHTGEIYYKIPYLGKSEWGLSANILRWASVEPLFFNEGAVRFNYNNDAVGLSIYRHFGIPHEVELGLTVFKETYSKLAIQDIENPPGPDLLTKDKLLFKLGYVLDEIDYYDFRLQKYRWVTLLQTVYTTDEKSYFHSLITEWRQYYRTGANGNIALKLRGAISTNNDTPFAPFVVDSHVNLRGVGNRIDRGTAQLIINLEYRHAFINASDWASQFVVFTDAGSWRNPGGELSQLFDSEQFRQFVGGGFRIIYKRMYDAILRIDYGVDVFNPEQKGWVIGIGQYF